MKDMINFEIRQGKYQLEMLDAKGEVVKEFPAIALFKEMRETTEYYNNLPDGCIGVTFTIA